MPAFCGRDDLFELVGEKTRPPYRWLLVGPKRSGTCAHIDPLGTSAWNAVLSGRKRWVLFEPGTSKHVAKGTKLFDPKQEDDEPINYFVDILPRIRKAYPDARRIEFSPASASRRAFFETRRRGEARRVGASRSLERRSSSRVAGGTPSSTSTIASASRRTL